jgi:hypothetical protein
MVTLLLDSTRLDVVLSGAERMLAFRKGDVTAERSTITKVQLIDDAWTWLRGVPNPGSHVRGVIAMGTWRSTSTNDFVIVRRHRPGVVIDLEGHPEFDRIVLTTRNGLELVQALRVDVDEADAPTEVTTLATGPIRTSRGLGGIGAPAPAV